MKLVYFSCPEIVSTYDMTVSKQRERPKRPDTAVCGRTNGLRFPESPLKPYAPRASVARISRQVADSWPS